MKLLSTILFCFANVAVAFASVYNVKSPNGRICLSLEHDNGLFYSITYDGKEIISRSSLGVAIENKLFESALAVPNEPKEVRGKGWCSNLQFVNALYSSVDNTWCPPYGEWNCIRDSYNELTVLLKKGEEEKREDGVGGTSYVKSKCYFFNVKVRAYDEGVAFCYEFPETSNGLFLHLTDEITEFRMADKGRSIAKSWTSEWAQGPFVNPDLTKPFDGELERPFTMIRHDGICVSLLEARLEDYVRTKFTLKGDGIIKAQPYSSCDVMTPFSTSWRVVMIGESMADLCNHDYLVLNLNKQQADEDFSWIKPGKAFRCDLNKEALFAGIDFAAQHGLQYIHLDAGWYGPEMKMSSSALSVAPERDFTLPEIVEYAKRKGIGVFVYVNQRALYQELDSVCARLEQWGVKGVKFGFVQVGNQKWTSWLHEAVKVCARHHLMVDIHDEYRPTGFSRTYPNLMTAEGIRGNEEMPDAKHNVTLPFTRFLCGPADYTLCYFNSRVKNTHAHQLAMAAVYYSPLTWMFWYDKPQFYNNESELEFWEKIPTTWDDTRVLQCEPENYIVTARRSGNEWYIGAMNGTDSHTVNLPLSFLDKGQKYIAHIYEDAPEISSDISKPQKKECKRTKMRSVSRKVTSTTVLSLPLQPSGGCAIIFTLTK